MGCDASLKIPIHGHCLFMQAISTRKVGQTDLVFGMRSGFISRSVHVRLQVCVCSAVTICSTLVNIQTHIHTHTDSILTSLYESSARDKHYYCTGTDNHKQSNTTLHKPETQKRNREKLPYLTKQSKPWFGMAFTTSGQETKWALFLQPRSPHGAKWCIQL